MKNQPRIKALLQLLDDEQDATAHAAMGALLAYRGELAEYLADLQESENPLIRKRIHQLQSILLLRQRREAFSGYLKERNYDLLDALMAAHLQWYDNDSEPNLADLWQSFSDAAKKFGIANLEQMADFMRKYSFAPAPEGELPSPDYYCIGAVLEERIGADILLCAIVLELAAENGFDLCVIRYCGDFAILDRRGTILSPRNSWQLLQPTDAANCEFWDDPRKIIKYVIATLFLYATSSDSFRYVYTIGHAVAGLPDDEPLDFLPYPYGQADQHT